MQRDGLGLYRPQVERCRFLDILSRDGQDSSCEGSKRHSCDTTSESAKAHVGVLLRFAGHGPAASTTSMEYAGRTTWMRCYVRDSPDPLRIAVCDGADHFGNLDAAGGPER